MNTRNWMIVLGLVIAAGLLGLHGLNSQTAEPQPEVDFELIERVPWIIGLDNRVYKWNTDGWQLVEPPATAQDLAVAPDGTPWLIGLDQRLYRLQENRWVAVEPEGFAQAIVFANP